MPFTKAQLKNITQSRGQAFIPRDRGSYSMRVAETYIRRKLYSWEDQTIRKEYDLFQQASADIRNYAVDIATRDRVDMGWKKAVLARAEGRMMRLASEVFLNARTAQETAYYAGYIGRLWVMDSMTVDDAPLNKGRIQPRNFPDADELNTQYNTALLQGLVKLRSRATQAVINEMPVAQAAKLLSDLGQRQTSPQGMFYQMQLITRSAIMRTSNYGLLDAVLAQAQPQTEAVSSDREWVVGIQWLSQRDNRVCAICERLDGQIWLLSELWGIALTQLPPDGSHYGCRCTYAILLIPNILKPEDEPPDLTFNEWLDENGYAMVIDTFAQDTRLASTQI